MVREVIVLGAGASKPDGMPTQAALLPLLIAGNDDRALRVRKGMEDFFGPFSRGTTAPTFEEVLGVLDLAIQRQESFRGYPNSGSKSKVSEFREDLIFGIAKALEQAGEKKRAIYGRRLIDRLAEDGQLLETGFVSLNYDIIIDNALIDKFPAIDIDYGVPYANYGDSPRQWQKAREGQSVPLFKIHGSLNWMYCAACTGLEISADGKGAAKLADRPRPCNKCGASLVPIVIPPSYFKALTNIHLHTVWNRTEQLLREADSLVFCGYSFPDADLHFKYVLKRAEMGRSKPWKISVVNARQRSTVMQEAEEERYTRFFSSKSTVTFTGMKFETYARSGLPVRT